MDNKALYSSSLTREPFMFYEMKVTARLLNEGLTDSYVIQKIIDNNLYQYPTEKSLKIRAQACVRRLRYIDKEMLMWISTKPIDVAKQVCLYALMKDSRLVNDFLITVIGGKYATGDFYYKRSIIKEYFIQLQEQNKKVNLWSETTIKKLSSVISNILKEVGYIDNFNSNRLNEIVIYYKLKEKIILNNEEKLLLAFNDFGESNE